MKSVNESTREDLISLPHRLWGESSEYDSLLILSTGEPHDSGWAMMLVVGVVGGYPKEIASSCSDDIEWKFPPARTFFDGKYSLGQMRTDCAIASGAIHAWCNRGKFRVGESLSSITVELVNANHSPEAKP